MTDSSSPSPSVFERLYKTQTCSSSMKRTTESQSSSKDRARSGKKNTLSGSSAKKHSKLLANPKSRPQSIHARGQKDPANGSESRPTDTEIHQQQQQQKQKEATKIHTAGGPRSSHNAIHTTLLCSSKYDKEKEPFHTLSPQDLKLVETLASYEDGSFSKQRVSLAIIEALFQRDFTPGRHWDIDSATATELDDDGRLYAVEKEATWDWKDIYSVFSCKATIRFVPERNEIRVENYSDYCAG